MTTERIDIVVTEKGSKVVRRNIEGIGKGATTAQGAVQLLRRSLGLLGGALVLGNAVRTLASFSQEMSTVKAITNATTDQFTALREEAKRLGAETRFSATQAAEGMTFLARAGFDTNQVLATIGGTLNLAQAGALGLGRAADIASNVLKGFRLEVDQTGRVVDVLAATANRSNTTVEQLGDGMKFVAPVAAGLGVSLEETAAAIGTLSDAGLQASLAGTGLRRVLSELESPASKTQKILGALGLSTEDVRVSQVGLTEALTRLKEAGVDTGLALELFGDRGGPAFEVLSASLPSLAQMTEGLRDVDGFAQQVAATMDDNLNGAILATRSAFEAVTIAVGDFGAESFLKTGFQRLAKGLRFVATNIDDVVAALKIMGVGFLALKLPQVIGLFRALAVAIALNPFTVLVVGITAATAALTVMRDQMLLTEDGTVTLGDAMSAAGETIATSLTEAVNGLGGTFENFDEIGVAVINNFAKGLVFLLATANGVVKAMSAAFDDFPRALKAVARTAWNGFLDLTESALNKFINAVNSALEFLGVEKAFGGFDLTLAKAEGETAGETLGVAFKQGFDEVLINTLEASAVRRAEAAAEATKKLAGGGGGGTGGGGGGGGGGPGGGGGSVAINTATVGEQGETFASLLRNLKEENELLQLTGVAREQRAAVLDFEDQLARRLTVTETQLVESLTAETIALEEQQHLLETIRGPQEEFAQGQETLAALLAKGKINIEEFNVELRKMKIELLDTQTDAGSGFERGFLKAQTEMEDFASSSERLIGDAFSDAQDTVVGFFKTGKFEADDFFKSLADNFLQLGTQQLFAGVFGGGGSGGGGGLFSSLFSGGGSGGGGGGLGGGIGSFVSGLFGFQNGGSFTVGPSAAAGSLGGIDNRLIAFRAQDGEQVTVTPKNSAGNQQGPINQVFNVTTPDANSFRRSQTQLQNKAMAGLNRARSRR